MPGSPPNPSRPTGPVLVTGASGTIGRRLVPALVAAGHQVRAMTRSDAAAQTAAAAGAEPVCGDVTDPASLSAAVHGCQVVIHAAGRMGASPAIEPFWPVNVTGTRNMLAAAADAQVRRFIYLGAAMSLLGSPRPITGADESWPLQQPRCSGYATSKTRADHAVQAANGPQMATVVIRPGWVWGTADDPSTASFVQAVRAGQMRLIDGGRHRIVATHIDNLIHAVSLAIDHGAGGRGYYVFDDGSTTVRDFLAGLLQAHGLTLPEASIPGPAAAGLARALDIGWRITRRPGDPPITRMIVELNRRPFLISDARARRELRYQPVITRRQGIQRLRDALRATVQPANPGVLSADETSGTLSTKTVKLTHHRPPFGSPGRSTLK
jgi:nucleoside-diphosphate-sugar epimerase